MTINRESSEISKKERYLLANDPRIQKMSSAPEVLGVSAYLMFDDVRADGTINKITSIMDETGAIYASNSVTFYSAFETIVECFGDDFNHIRILHGKTKSGRDFLTCTYED